MDKLKFSTKLLHSKLTKADPHGSLHIPIYNNVAYEFAKSKELEDAFSGRKFAHIYSRISNPTVEHFEKKIKEATDSLAALAVSSGMAAISNLILTVCGCGDKIITSRHLFGNTYSLFKQTLSEWGLRVDFVDLKNRAEVEKSIDKDTKLIFFETITNPQLEVVDVKALSKLAKAKNILLTADTTLTPPYMFDSKKFGVDIELLSSTKYISGGATSVGGLIIDNGTYNWKNNNKLSKDAKKYGPFALMARLRQQVYRNIGACLSAQSAFLQLLGLETLTLRIDKSCDNSLEVAKFLEKQKNIKSVNYPGLKDSPYYQLAKKQFNKKFGSILTFELGSKEECFKFMDRLKLIRRATNLQDNRTLILHPASTIFSEYPKEVKEEMGIADTMIRLAVGIEDKEDLIKDIKQSLGG